MNRRFKMTEYQIPILIKATQSVVADTLNEAINKIAQCDNYLVDYQAIDATQKAKIFKQKELTFEQWIAEYKPLKNPKTFFRSSARELDNFITKEFYHYLYPDNDTTLDWVKTMPPAVIWTLINPDYCIDYKEPDKELRIISGFYPPDTDFNTDASVEGYFLTEKGLLLAEAYQLIILGD